MWPAVEAMLHSVYDQPNAAVNAQFDRLLDYIAEKLPAVAKHLVELRCLKSRGSLQDVVDPPQIGVLAP